MGSPSPQQPRGPGPPHWDRGVSQGEYFDAAAVAGSARLALIGETVARELFRGEDPIGAEIQIGSVPFCVTGILGRQGTDIHGMDRDNALPPLRPPC